MSFRSRKYARVWREVANFGPYRPPRSKTELLSTPFLIMITTRTSGVSGKLTWWFIPLLTFTFQYPSTSIIDPFPSSPSILYFHNFRNRLTWPPRRLHILSNKVTVTALFKEGVRETFLFQSLMKPDV